MFHAVLPDWFYIPIMKSYVPVLTFLFFSALPIHRSFSQDQTNPLPANSKPNIDMSNRWGLGIKAGLNGVGLEIVKGLGDKVNARIGYSWLSVPYSAIQILEEYTLQVDARVTLGGASILIDYYPVTSIFHLTGGLILNNSLVGINIQSLSSVPYGDIIIPPEDVGTISGQVSPGNILSPYFAIGAGNTLARNHRISFNLEIGTFYQGTPRINLSGHGVIGPMASLNNTLVINKAIAQYSWFPMFSILMTYRIS
jgi:hypothetical protein